MSTQLYAEPLQLSNRSMQQIVKLVYDSSGINLGDGKRELVVARLQKRIRTLQLDSFEDYIARLAKDQSGEELVLLLDAIATNHTSFFRENEHFNYLKRFVEERGRTTGSPLSVWCAACSTGEEPYTIAMTLSGAGGYRLLASDLSTKVLSAAAAGVFKMATVASVPRELLRAHFERGVGDQIGQARVNAALRRTIEFRRLNLLEIGDLGERFDVVFCRNVMIYFDTAVQQRVVSMLERHLRDDGYLFIGHSENLSSIQHRFTWVAPAVYQKKKSS